VGGADFKVLGKVLLQAHPALALSNFATPCTNSEHSFKVMKTRHQAPSQGMNEGPNQKDQDRLHSTIAPFGGVQVAADQQMRQIHCLINPGKKKDQAETEALVPQNFGPTFLNVHDQANFRVRGSRATMHLFGNIT